ncbi:hypothetical protein E4U53_002943 [Claviceps sorghi]|nr:hypothetical protein E4U53_002943 [Claviceps sorghi]
MLSLRIGLSISTPDATLLQHERRAQLAPTVSRRPQAQQSSWHDTHTVGPADEEVLQSRQDEPARSVTHNSTSSNRQSVPKERAGLECTPADIWTACLVRSRPER